MSKHARSRDVDTALEQQFERLAAAQRNVTPHDQLPNGRFVDDALWNGFERPRSIQRAGVFVLAATLFLMGFAITVKNLELRNGHRIYPEALVGTLFIAVSMKLGINAFRPRKKKRLLD